MGEVLAIDGVWDTDLIETMLPVAIKLQADDAETLYGATAAAVSTISGGKAAKEFMKGLANIKDQALRSMRKVRGADNKDPRISEAADKMTQIAQKLGLKRVSIKKGKKAPPKGTRIHGGPI